MNILADESVDAPVISRLRVDGHDVVAIAEMSPGITDSAVLAEAVNGHRALLTADRDFGDIIMRDAQTAPLEGVVLYRLHHVSVAEKAKRIATVLHERETRIAGAFTVIERERVRHRPLI